MEPDVLFTAVLGNVHDGAEWMERFGDADVETIHLDQWQAQKCRLRVRGSKGHEFALLMPRNMVLRDGDVLHYEPIPKTMVVVNVDITPVMEVDLTELFQQTDLCVRRTLFEMGHAMGNQHWPALMKGDKVYVPLVVDMTMMSSVMDTHHFEFVTYVFRAASEVIPLLAPHEARVLFSH